MFLFSSFCLFCLLKLYHIFCWFNCCCLSLLSNHICLLNTVKSLLSQWHVWFPPCEWVWVWSPSGTKSLTLTVTKKSPLNSQHNSIVKCRFNVIVSNALVSFYRHCTCLILSFLMKYCRFKLVVSAPDPKKLTSPTITNIQVPIQPSFSNWEWLDHDGSERSSLWLTPLKYKFEVH